MPKHTYIRGVRAERPLRPAGLRTGRSILRTLAGIVLIAGVGVVSFTIGYPSASNSAGQIAVAEAKPASGGARDEIRTASDRTRPDWLAKLASAPIAPPAQDDPPTSLASSALAERIEAAASVTGSISMPKKPLRTVPVVKQAPSGPKPQAGAVQRPVVPVAEKHAARTMPSPAPKKMAASERAAPASGTLAEFFRRPGLSKPLAPPDPAR